MTPFGRFGAMRPKRGIFPDTRLCKAGWLWHTSQYHYNSDQFIAEFGTNRVRYRFNLVIEATETHLTIVLNNQQQGAQKAGSNTQLSPKPKPALPVGRESIQTAAAQAGTAATARLSLPICCSNEAGTKAATPRYDVVTNTIVSVDIIYNLR